MCSYYRIAVGIDGNDTAVYGYIPVLPSALYDSLGRTYLLSAPYHTVVTFKGEISLYTDSAKLRCVELGDIVQ